MLDAPVGPLQGGGGGAVDDDVVEVGGVEEALEAAHLVHGGQHGLGHLGPLRHRHGRPPGRQAPGRLGRQRLVGEVPRQLLLLVGAEGGQPGRGPVAGLGGEAFADLGAHGGHVVVVGH
ncbi:MAG: hypothetical protein ACRD0N_01835 [Acidimicrobiales bacterium]